MSGMTEGQQETLVERVKVLEEAVRQALEALQSKRWSDRQARVLASDALLTATPTEADR